MAQTGYTPISLYYSTTASTAPTAGNLVAGELAINTNDGVLYYKDSSGVVQSIASKAGNSGSFTNLAYTGTFTGGTGVIAIGTNQIYKDASGNVGIGTSSPTGKTTINYSANSAYNTGLSVYNASSGSSATVSFQLTNDAGNRAGAYLTSSTCAFYGGANTFNLGTVESIPFTFLTGNSERARIDTSGNLLVGTTSSGDTNTNSFRLLQSAGYQVTSHINGTSSGTYYDAFYYNATLIGGVTQNGTTGVLYNIVSDRRLKENIVDAPSALSLIDSVKVRSFDFKSDGSHTDFGLIAQEFYEVAPQCVSKGDDGEQIEQTWGLDASALVPAMIKAIQELNAKVEALEAQLAVK